MTISVQRRQGTGAWTNVVVDVTSTVATFGATVTSTGNDVVQSYEFRVVLTDQFNRTATATATVTTQKVVLDIHKNEGVGIGKLHEEGALDISGLTHIHGDALRLFNGGNTLQIRSPFANGHGFMSWFGSDGVRKGYVGFGGSDSNIFTVNNESNGELRLYGDKVMVGTTEIASRGSNSNGEYVRFYDGTQICWQRFSVSNMSGGVHTSTRPFPIAFLSGPVMTLSRDGYIGNTAVHDRATMSATEGATEFTFNYFSGTGTGLSGTRGLRYIAIGRWR